MIRDARADDIPALVRLGAVMHAESVYRALPYEAEKVARNLGLVLERSEGLLLVAERDGVVIGGVAVFASDYWFCHETCAQDLALFIDPKARGGMAAARLVCRALSWAERTGCRELRMGITTGVAEDTTAKLYQACGMERAGSLWTRRFQACA